MTEYTDEEIIRALKCCLLSNSHQEEECDKCPLYETPLTICQNLMAYYALDLINRQKAEIETLKDNNEHLAVFLVESKSEIADYILELSDKWGGGVAFYHKMRKYAEDLKNTEVDNDDNN